jgi:alanine racemase
MPCGYLEPLARLSLGGKALASHDHFACADEQHHPLNLMQWDRFRRAVEGLGGGGALPIPRPYWSLPRPMPIGAAGHHAVWHLAFADSTRAGQGLEPVMTLRSNSWRCAGVAERR